MKKQEENKQTWNFCEDGKIELHGKFTKKELEKFCNLLEFDIIKPQTFLKLLALSFSEKTEVDFW